MAADRQAAGAQAACVAAATAAVAAAAVTTASPRRRTGQQLAVARLAIPVLCALLAASPLLSNVLRGTTSGCRPDLSDGDSTEWPWVSNTCMQTHSMPGQGVQNKTIVGSNFAKHCLLMA